MPTMWQHWRSQRAPCWHGVHARWQQKEGSGSGCWDSTTGFLEGRGLEDFLGTKRAGWVTTRSRGFKAWWAQVTASDSILTGTWRAGPAWSSLSPQDGWLSYLSPLILVYTKLEFILVLVSHWIVSYLGTMAMLCPLASPSGTEPSHKGTQWMLTCLQKW